MTKQAAILASLLTACAGPAAASAPAAGDPPAATPQAAAQAPAPQRTLRVSADGRATVKPDVAVVQTGVRLTAKTAEKAAAEASARMRMLLDELARHGVAAEDVQTSQLSLAAERPWENGRQLPVTGYTAANTVTVKVRALDTLPALLGRLPAAGANAIDSVQFGRDELGPVRDEALALAVKAARARAAVVAKAAGVTLGDVLTIEVQQAGHPVPLGANAMAVRGFAGAEADAPVAPGELEVTAAVELVFSIR
jgi:uncharacterized protein YggE